MSNDQLESIVSALEETYGSSGRDAADRLQQWIAGTEPFSFPETLRELLDPARLALIYDSFWQDLPFGTGGRRGRSGFGPNRINPTTVAKTIQGHCNYLKESESGDISVVVANDVRVYLDVSGAYPFLDNNPLIGLSSRDYAKLACEIYAGNGILAYLLDPDDDSAIMTTPELSFAIKQLGANGGVNFSASHNMPDDNGIKIYDSFGSQPIAPHDQFLLDAMQSATSIDKIDYRQGRTDNAIREIPAQVHQDYLALYAEVYKGSPTPDPTVPVVYTPLCGCGMTTIYETLSALGFSVSCPPGEDKPDGSFEVIPFRAPNPEVRQATAAACRFADEIGSTIVLSSDPDADRVGVEIKLQDGSWYHFDGNQIAAVLAYYLMLDGAGPRRRGLLVETLVTTKLIAGVAERAQDSAVVDDLLVGFKYVAHVLKELETKGRYKHVTASPDDLILAAEESHGVIVGPWIMDKDATGACIFLAALHQRLKSEGRTLLDYYKEILRDLGAYDSANRSIVMSGAEGVAKRDEIMASLRATPLDEICGYPVSKWVDYWNESPSDEGGFGPFASDSDVLPRNVLQLYTERLVVTIRPSGTEPKLKLYCQLLPVAGDESGAGVDLDELRATTDGYASQVYNVLLSRVGVALSDVALQLPDIVDMQSKSEFDVNTIPALVECMQSDRFESIDGLLEWLKEQTSSMTPGGDPLPALKGAIGRMCSANDNPLSNTRLADELRRWSVS